MSALKLPFLLSDAIAMRVSATPPNPPSPPKDHIIPDWRERFLKALGLPCVLLRGVYWSAAFIEMTVIIAKGNPSGPISKHVLSTLAANGTSERIRFTPLFFFGVMLSLCGTLLRVQSFRTLGRLFTFELCIRDDHALITDGPYSVILCANVTGSWVRECGLLNTWFGRSLVFMWLLVAAAVILSLFLRIPSEEKILKRRFGPEWEEWADNVPYKLIPGVF
ncbi:hypothetical protein BDQ17DRAFT_1393391 [Cyathus striatus]|nr:hypothetical protein BDQ17DRAFT_1393391 [Cyathus striatus]